MPNFLTTPDKASIAELEPFHGFGLEKIVLVKDLQAAEAAYEDLKQAKDVGFDTESKPTFIKGQKSDGPHVFQFATRERAYLFQTFRAEIEPVIVRLLKCEEITKIGFDLRGDLSHIWRRYNVRPAEIIDLDRSFRKLGYRNAVGAKSAIAILFNKRLLKSKSVTTSNWAIRELSNSQLIYAANDAFVALLVHQTLRERWSPDEIDRRLI